VDGKPSGVRSATRDQQHMTPDWDVVRDGIDGVRRREVKHIVTANGHTTELFRADWGLADNAIVATIHVTLRANAVSAWHMHKIQTDHLFVIAGALRLVLYDDREESPTRTKLDVLNLSAMRPTLIVIPPGIWHGIHAAPTHSASFVNFFDHAYDYSDPDEWRLPSDSDEIPFRF
jgi:dTDP-4-dehydrorhamnose 3,5-epimerase